MILDSGPLGVISGDPSKTRTSRMNTWLISYVNVGYEIVIPEIADYEMRRELIRTRSFSGVVRLEALYERFLYLKITTIAMRQAAELWAQVRQVWAQVRQEGRPTASPDALDADCILAGQAVTFARPNDHLAIATTNVRHLSRFSGFELELCPM